MSQVSENLGLILSDDSDEFDHNIFLRGNFEKIDEQMATKEDLAGKVESTNIIQIRDTGNVLEYTLDGINWRQVNVVNDRLESAIEPVTGVFVPSQRIYNSSPVAGGYLGWVCVTGGTANNNQWTTGKIYVVNDLAYNGANVYKCVTGGTSGATAPTGTGTSISDGICTWNYADTKAVFKQFGAISL